MNYIKQINEFYKFMLSNKITVQGQALYNILLMLNNKCCWIPWFEHSLSSLTKITGLSPNSVRKARNELRDLGLIEFISKSGSTSLTKYSIKKLYVENVATKSSSYSQEGSERDSCDEPLNKSNINKLNINKPNSNKPNLNKLSINNNNSTTTKNVQGEFINGKFTSRNNGTNRQTDRAETRFSPDSII